MNIADWSMQLRNLDSFDHAEDCFDIVDYSKLLHIQGMTDRVMDLPNIVVLDMPRHNLDKSDQITDFGCIAD